MGKAGEGCKLPCLMDSGIQLSIWKFQTFKRDRLKWPSGIAGTWFHSSVGIIVYVCWIRWGKSLLEQRHTSISQPSGIKATTALLPPRHSAVFPSFRAPHHFHQHGNSSNWKNQQASASGSKCRVMTNSLSVLVGFLKIFRGKSTHWVVFPATSCDCPGGTEPSMPGHHLPCLQSHHGTWWKQRLCWMWGMQHLQGSVHWYVLPLTMHWAVFAWEGKA